MFIPIPHQYHSYSIPALFPVHPGLILILTNLKVTIVGGPDKDVWNCVWGSRNLDGEWIDL